MKSIYDPVTLKDVLERIQKINKDVKPVWGKMNASQMMEHCARTLDFVTGKIKPKRLLLGYILGTILKSQSYNDKPWSKSSPTAKLYTVTDTPEFENTRKRLTTLLMEFSTGGLAKCTKHPSPFFGYLTPEQHGMAVYKHVDHHLHQFGV